MVDANGQANEAEPKTATTTITDNESVRNNDKHQLTNGNNNNNNNNNENGLNGNNTMEKSKSKIIPKIEVIPESDEPKPKSEFSIGVVLVKCLVILYDIITFPFYWLIQQPWKKLEKQQQAKAKLIDPNDPYSSYVRVKSLPKNHYGFKAQTIPELQQLTYKLNAKDKTMLGRRRILDVITEITSKGKKLLKYRLTDYEWLTNEEVNQTITELTSGFLSDNIKYQQLVLIYAETRMEWFLCALALFRIGAVLTTLYTALGLKSIAYGINETEVECIITTEDLLPQLLKVIKEIKRVKKIYVIRQHPGLLKGNPVTQEDFVKALKDEEGEECRVKLVYYDDLKELGRKHIEENEDYVRPQPDDLALILYTSGSTGNPKGAKFTHRNIVTSIHCAYGILGQEIFDEFEIHCYLAVLPLAHMFELLMEVAFLGLGIRVGYGTPYTMTDTSTAIISGQKGDVKLLRPTMMAGVPLLLDRIRKLVTDRFERKKSIFWKQLIKYCIAYKSYWLQRGFDTPIINHFICKRLNGNLGGNVKYFVCAGAPLNPDTQRMMRALLDIQILTGYGATETGGASTLMELDDLSIGYVGAPLDNVRIRLEDWPEGGYSVHDKPLPRGEIIIGGPSVSLGYFKLPDKTAEVFENRDGIRWFRTGDIGEISDVGTLRIIDRKKDLVKLQFGEYVPLGKVEAVLKNFRYVENVVAYGDSFHTYIIALIQPSRGALKMLAEDLQKSNLSFEELCDDPEIIATILKELKEFCLESGLHKMETPQKIKLCKEEWTLASGLLTASFKIKRREIQKFYQKTIDELYGRA